MVDRSAGPVATSWLGDVLPQPYTDMMRQFFVHSADEILRQRLPAYGRQAWELRREQVRVGLLQALGGFPERTPLNARVTKVHRMDGYSIENVIFESRPGFHVTASVFVPEQMVRPAPGILLPHGHWPKGRYQDVVQRRCIGLARRGYVALSLDAVGYNERQPQGHRNSWFLFSAGLTLQAIECWDNIRAIDYLCSREDVDPERIGCTGASGGGNQTMYVSALDERIKAAVPVCSVEMISDYMVKDFCTCEAIPGEVRVADLTEICGLIAPRALLLIHGILDQGFPILEARRAASRIRDIYRLYDSERFSTFESYCEHDYNAEMRQAMYNWFDRWLMGHDTCSEEEVVDDRLLRALPDGLPAGDASLASLFVERTATLMPRSEPTSRQAWLERRQELTAGLWQVLGGQPLRTGHDERLLDISREQGVRTERLWLRSEPDIVLPCCLLVPHGDEPHDVTVYLLQGGKASLSHDEAQTQMREGRAVFAFDQRGTGETAYPHHLAFPSAFALGRPLLGMYVWDTIRCLDYLCERPDVARIHLVAGGSPEAAMAGLLTAALDRRVASVSLDSLPATLAVPSEQPEFTTLYLPNLLRHGDIADIAAMIAPRPLRVSALLDEHLARLSAEDSRQVFLPTQRIYSLMGAPAALELPFGSV